MNRSPEEVAIHSHRACREWISAQPERLRNQLTNSRQQDLGLGSYSPITTIKCNTDASWRKESLQTGLGWIFSDPQSELKDKGTQIQHFVGSPLMAKALACRSSLHHAIALGLVDLQVLSDNQTLIRAINSKQPPKEIFGVVSDINHLAACFLSITISFVYRSANVEADTLSKEALRFYPTGPGMG